MTVPPAVIAFDLDGTLVDTAPDLLDALDAALAPLDLPPPDRPTVRRLIGRGGRALIVRALADAGRGLPDTEIDGLHRAFLAHYGENIAVGSRPYPGLAEALDRLAGRGLPLAVCTNKTERLARRLLDSLGLTGRFSAITGADTYARPKPDALPLLSTIAAAGGAAPRAVMVGDSATDIATARAAGVPVIAVGFGYTEIPAEELGADLLIQHYDELEAAVDRALAGAGA